VFLLPSLLIVPLTVDFFLVYIRKEAGVCSSPGAVDARLVDAEA